MKFKLIYIFLLITQFFLNGCKKDHTSELEDIDFRQNGSHITPITLGNPEKCKSIADKLLHNYGIYIQPINYPTVPHGEECLRVTITSAHNEDQIYHLVQSLKACLHV